MKYIKYLFLSLLLTLTLGVLTSCAPTQPPTDRQNICSIFRQYPKWYWTAEDVRTKWGLPISTLMAIMYQESRFSAIAKPPRKKLLWVIPWFRPTSASGYSQAVRQTWLTYKRDTGNTRANRNNFADAADFVGWYSNFASKKLGISKADAYRLYLAYHEGTGGYASGSYKRKQWLIDVSRGVQRRAWTFQMQLKACESSLPQKHWWNFW